MKTLCRAKWKDSGRKMGRAEKSKAPCFCPIHLSAAKTSGQRFLPHLEGKMTAYSRVSGEKGSLAEASKVPFFCPTHISAITLWLNFESNPVTVSQTDVLVKVADKIYVNNLK
jgi:hypothetical protein